MGPETLPRKKLTKCQVFSRGQKRSDCIPNGQNKKDLKTGLLKFGPGIHSQLDLVPVAFLFLSFYYLKKKKIFQGSFVFALACSIKTNAMLSGIVMGHKQMVEGMIKMCEKELGEKATIVATGGFSKTLFDSLERKTDYVNKNLTLFGLKTVYELNKGER